MNRVFAPNRHRALALLGAVALLSACSGADEGTELQKINGSIHVLAGKVPRVAESVNGGIHIDDNAKVSLANTVNGGITLGDRASADALNSVNGTITLGAGARVAKDAASVNGGVILGDGAEVLGGIANVNGKIELDAAHVAGGIKTVNGNISIRGASRVDGGIVVEKNSGLIHISRVPLIEIGPGATVQGTLRFDRAVKLYVSDKATIGPVSGATPIPFTGDIPSEADSGSAGGSIHAPSGTSP